MLLPSSDEDDSTPTAQVAKASTATTGPTSTPAPTSTTGPMPTPTPEAPVITYTIQAGDTLGIIAKDYGLTVELLADLNNIENANAIEVGQVLVVSAPPGWEPPPTPTALPEPETITTSKGETLSVPGNAFMDGRDLEAQPALTVMNISIWNAVPRQRVVCKVRHGTSVQVHQMRYYSSEGLNYFLAQSGDCKGWVSEPFLAREKHEPIGDRFE